MSLTSHELMQSVDAQLSHVWMVRTFLKHCEEAEEDDDLTEVHRDLYDYMHSLGATLAAGDAEGYLKQARKKLSKLVKATELFRRIQPEVSIHTNFQNAARSLNVAVERIVSLLAVAE